MPSPTTHPLLLEVGRQVGYPTDGLLLALRTAARNRHCLSHQDTAQTHGMGSVLVVNAAEHTTTHNSRKENKIRDDRVGQLTCATKEMTCQVG